jgi:glutamyl-tRNA synthetase
MNSESDATELNYCRIRIKLHLRKQSKMTEDDSVQKHPSRMSLTLSSKSSPFPFSAIAIAAYTGKINVVFDEAASGITLELAGSTHNDESDIIQAIAKAADLADDSSRVCTHSRVPRPTPYFLPSLRHTIPLL